MRWSTLCALLAAAIVAGTGCSRKVVVGDRGGPRPYGDVVVVGPHGARSAGHGVGKGARVRGPRKLKGVPPGHYPPPGQCRVWYPGRPPGHQAPPTRCGALRGRVPRGAFVLYNSAAWDRDYDWRYHNRRHPGTVPELILDILYGTAARR